MLRKQPIEMKTSANFVGVDYWAHSGCRRLSTTRMCPIPHFRAICRTNRLDGVDKDFGYIVDYEDLFKKVEKAISVYTSELDHSAGGVDPAVLMRDRLTKGRERIDTALEVFDLLCEPVQPPKGELE